MARTYNPTIILPNRTVPGPGMIDPNDRQYALRVLAEGDSWYSVGSIPTSNLLYGLGFADSTLLLNLAYPGDTIIHMSDIEQNHDLFGFLARPNYAIKWDAILLSGGGNDLIDAVQRIVLPAAASGQDPKLAASYIDTDVCAKVTQSIVSSYKTVVGIRDSVGGPNRGVPIIIHTYDYATPRDAPVSFAGLALPLGPWLYPVVKAFAGPLQLSIADLLIDTLATTLLSLDTASKSANALPAFHVVDTRGTLKRAKQGTSGDSNDWTNEIHPNHDGYSKLSSKLSPVINTLIGSK
ncbi:hypothetical protein [Silvimonas iriomotensis]|nr:hypothetical protein [Silvimonas iriomotensis]